MREDREYTLLLKSRSSCRNRLLPLGVERHLPGFLEERERVPRVVHLVAQELREREVGLQRDIRRLSCRR